MLRYSSMAWFCSFSSRWCYFYVSAFVVNKDVYVYNTVYNYAISCILCITGADVLLLHKYSLLAGSPQWGGHWPAIVMDRVVRPSVCPSVYHTRVYFKHSEMELFFCETRTGNRATRLRKCHQICNWKYGSAILGISGSALHPLWQKLMYRYCCFIITV